MCIYAKYSAGYEVTLRKTKSKKNVRFFANIRNKHYICIKKRDEMYIEFDKEYLRELYEQGRTDDKRHRYQPEVIRGYQKAVFALLVANCITDLFRNNALNYEALQGGKTGISSVRINRKYRIEFTVRDMMNEQVITVCRLLDISNHYK